MKASCRDWGDINAQIVSNIGEYDKSNNWEDMDSGEQTRRLN